MADHYATLEIAETANDDEIKAAWKRIAHKTHPDKPGGSQSAFVAAQAAYDVLKNPITRADYDRERRRPRTSPSGSASYNPYHSPPPSSYNPTPQREPFRRPKPNHRAEYRERYEDPGWWSDSWAPHGPSPVHAPRYDHLQAQLDFDLEQMELELQFAEKFAYDRSGLCAGEGRHAKNVFRSKFRNGGNLS